MHRHAVLESVDTGVSTRSTDVLVKCRTCLEQRSVAQAFGEGSEQVLPRCRGRHPHLRQFDPSGYVEQAQALLLDDLQRVRRSRRDASRATPLTQLLRAIIARIACSRDSEAGGQ